MKIEDTPFQFTTTTVSGLDSQGRVRRVMGGTGAGYGGFDMLDMAFIELLGTVGTPTDPANADANALNELGGTSAKPKADKSQSASENASTARQNLPVAPDATHASGNSGDIRKDVQKELSILNTSLTDADRNYLKNVVIPALPILQGSVPLNSVFATDGDTGNLNFTGQDLSQDLTELIQNGYKTGRPFRVDMDENSSIIIKIRNGRVSAEFISKDRAAALYIKQELDELRQRMAAKNLPVDLLSYREQKQQRQNNGYQPPDDEDNNV